jgi:hypothetical protein
MHYGSKHFMNPDSLVGIKLPNLGRKVIKEWADLIMEEGARKERELKENSAARCIVRVFFSWCMRKSRLFKFRHPNGKPRLQTDAAEEEAQLAAAEAAVAKLTAEQLEQMHNDFLEQAERLRHVGEDDFAAMREEEVAKMNPSSIDRRITSLLGAFRRFRREVLPKMLSDVSRFPDETGSLFSSSPKKRTGVSSSCLPSQLSLLARRGPMNEIPNTLETMASTRAFMPHERSPFDPVVSGLRLYDALPKPHIFSFESDEAFTYPVRGQALDAIARVIRRGSQNSSGSNTRRRTVVTDSLSRGVSTARGGSTTRSNVHYAFEGRYPSQSHATLNHNDSLERGESRARSTSPLNQHGGDYVPRYTPAPGSWSGMRTRELQKQQRLEARQLRNASPIIVVHGHEPAFTPKSLRDLRLEQAVVSSTRALRIVLKKLVAQNPAHARGAPWHAQREVGRFQFTSKFPLRVSDATEAVEELENKRGKLRAVGRLLFDGEVILHNAIELCKWETGRSKMQRNRTFRSPGTYPSQNLPIVNLQFAGALPNSGE